MTKQVFILLSFILLSNISFSQKENSNTSNIFTDLEKNSGGTVKIYESPSIRLQMEKHMETFAKKEGVHGYRIQIFFGSSKSAQKLATEARAKFISTYKDIKAHIEYNAPYFKVRVGDFREQSDALKLLEEIAEEYPEAFVVKDIIEVEDASKN